MTPQPEQLNEWVTLYEGDCMDVLPTLGPVDCVITDPPYGTTSNKWDVSFDLAEWWKAIRGACTGPVILTASQPFTAKMVVSNIEQFRHEWIWKKNAGSNFANTVREPMKEHESVLVFSAGKWVYNPQMQERAASGASRVKTPIKFQTGSDNYREFDRIETKKMPEMRVPSSVQNFNRQRGLHPTQKPVDLFRYLIRTYTNHSDIVLDCFAGSGTTGEAARLEGRKCILIERDARYCEVIRRRVREADGASPGKLFAPANDTSLFADGGSI